MKYILPVTRPSAIVIAIITWWRALCSSCKLFVGSDGIFLVVIQQSRPTERPTIVCASLCVCEWLLCLVFFIEVHLGNKDIFYQLSPLTSLVVVNFRNVTHTILNPSVRETVSIRENESQECRRGWGANPWRGQPIAARCVSHSATESRLYRLVTIIIWKQN